jgi:hypothetical protein
VSKRALDGSKEDYSHVNLGSRFVGRLYHRLRSADGRNSISQDFFDSPMLHSLSRQSCLYFFDDATHFNTIYIQFLIHVPFDSPRQN